MKSKKELEAIIREKRSAVLIVNTHSRKGEKAFFRALDLLYEKGITVVAAYPVRKPERLPQITREAVNRGHELIIVGGGDGTITSIMNFFHDRDVVLGVLPLGTANNFARTMGIPITLEGAIDVIAQMNVVDVDLAKANDQYFANMANIGYSADVVRAPPRIVKKYLGLVAYVLYGISLLITQSPFRAEISSNGDTRTVSTFQVLIANGSFYGTRKITPDACIDDRSLVFFTMDSLSRFQILKFWLGYLLGKHMDFPEACCINTGHATIDTVPQKTVYIDGDIAVKTPVTFSIMPEALRIAAPVSFVDKDD